MAKKSLNPISERVTLTKNPLPHLDVDFLDAQKKFFRQFMENGFEELFDEINPIKDYTGTSWELFFEDISWGEPKINFLDAQNLGQTYDAPVHANVKLVNKKSGEIKKQKLYFGNMPLIVKRASSMFMGNGRFFFFKILNSEGLLFR